MLLQARAHHDSKVSSSPNNMRQHCTCSAQQRQHPITHTKVSSHQAQRGVSHLVHLAPKIEPVSKAVDVQGGVHRPAGSSRCCKVSKITHNPMQVPRCVVEQRFASCWGTNAHAQCLQQLPASLGKHGVLGDAQQLGQLQEHGSKREHVDLGRNRGGGRVKG